MTNGGLLSVADGVMINEGKKFLEMMEVSILTLFDNEQHL